MKKLVKGIFSISNIIEFNEPENFFSLFEFNFDDFTKFRKHFFQISFCDLIIFIKKKISINSIIQQMSK